MRCSERDGRSIRWCRMGSFPHSRHRRLHSAGFGDYAATHYNAGTVADNDPPGFGCVPFRIEALRR